MLRQRSPSSESGLPVIASGGISHLEDVRGLMQHASAGICGAITGRAIYEARWICGPDYGRRVFGKRLMALAKRVIPC